MNTPYRAALAGMAAAALVFVAWLLLAPGHFLVDVAVALLAGAVVAAIVARMFPYDAALADYAADARRRVHRLNGDLDRIDAAARKISDRMVRALVTDGTAATRQVIENVQQHNPGSVASTAALLSDKAAKLRNITDGYLRYQAHAGLPASAQRMQACAAGFAHYKDFAQARLQQALDGDLRQLNADLAGLEPIDTLTLTQGDTHA